jgi:hypothetical protein
VAQVILLATLGKIWDNFLEQRMEWQIAFITAVPFPKGSHAGRNNHHLVVSLIIAASCRNSGPGLGAGIGHQEENHDDRETIVNSFTWEY